MKTEDGIFGNRIVDAVIVLTIAILGGVAANMVATGRGVEACVPTVSMTLLIVAAFGVVFFSLFQRISMVATKVAVSARTKVAMRVSGVCESHPLLVVHGCIALMFLGYVLYVLLAYAIPALKYMLR